MDQKKPGFFARKYNVAEESLLTIFKSPKIWGALLGEVIGTMLLTMLLMCSVGVFRVDWVPILLMSGVIGVYLVAVKLSGAQLNPLITVGMMASRRMSAIRGVLYILAQAIGAWIGFLVLNAFRLGGGLAGSGYGGEFPELISATGDNFWMLALVALLCSVTLAFVFARALRHAKKGALTFAFAVASSIIFVHLLSLIISQNFFAASGNLIFNPASALMYGILPTTAENFGALASAAGLALAAYVFIPMLGGVIGFYLSDIATRLAGTGYNHEDCHCDTKEA